MPTKIPDYTDNERHHLAFVLRTLIGEYEQRDMDIATGFFSPDVWRVVGEAFSALERLRLMIGKEPELHQNKRGLDLVREFRRKLRAELEDQELDSAQARMMDALIAFLKREAVQVRLFDDPFLHAKAYLMGEWSIVGSSNLTVNGVTHNSELNTVRKDSWVARGLREEWFERFWERAHDYKRDLIEELERSKFGSYPYTPYDVFLKVLFENFRDSLGLDTPQDERGVIELAEFQAEGFRLAKGLLDRFGGVMVADAVGLGKSFVGLSILEEYLINQRAQGRGQGVPRGLVVCPAQLERLVWRPLLDRFGIPAQVVSMESLGRDDFDWRPYANSDLVVVDESHNFRNPGTGRYLNLMRLLAGGRDKRVALLTATPVNNSIWDFYHQVLLMTRGREDVYAAHGVPNLRAFVTGVARGTREFYDLVEHAMVRRSRRDVRRRQERGEPVLINGREVRFPERVLHRVEYSLTEQFGDFYGGLVGRIERLRLVAYNLERYKRERDETEANRREALTGIFKTNFLKRLESSVHALAASVENQKRFQERFYELFKQGKLLDAGSNRKIEQVLRLAAAEDDTETQARVERLLASLPEVRALDYHVTDMERDIKLDLEALAWMQGAIKDLLVSRGSGGEQDAKVAAIKAALLGRTANKKIVVFSYYHDTAEYLYRALTGDAAWLAGMGLTGERAAFLSGASNAETRSDVVRRFAPRSNRRAEDDEADQQRLLARPIDLLISTDVLSEGQNLQDAGFLLNADLHWNPVRMIQRAGRIDRLGSEFETLEVDNVFPEEGLEAILGLVERLQTRIADIDRTVGLDASVLGEAISRRSFEELRRIRAEDSSVLDELEAESELSVGDEMRLPLIAALQLIGEGYVDGLPLGIHSAKRAPTAACGVFVALRVEDRVLWRVYPLEGEAPVRTSKREIYRLIEAGQGVPRADNPEGVEIYPFLERAIRDVLQESKRAVKKSAFKPPLRGAALALSRWLSDMHVQPQIAPEVLARLSYTVEHRSLSGFERDQDLREIVSGLGKQSVPTLAAALEAFLVDNKLLLERPPERVSVQEITRAQIKLIAYEWLVE